MHILKSMECICSRRDGRYANRDRVPSQIEERSTSSFQLEESRMWDFELGSHEL